MNIDLENRLNLISLQILFKHFSLLNSLLILIEILLVEKSNFIEISTYINCTTTVVFTGGF